MGKIFYSLSIQSGRLVEGLQMLSDAKVKSLKIEDGKRHADRDGLVLEIRSSGKKVFLFRFQWEKKPQTITLGNYPSLSLADARIKATSHRDLLNKGIDPRKGDINEQCKLTFREVAEQWHQKNTHRWKPVTSNRHYKSLTRDIYPFIGDKSINEITKAELLKIIHPHEQLGHRDLSGALRTKIFLIFFI